MPQPLETQERVPQSKDTVEEEYQRWCSENKPTFDPATHELVVHRFMRGDKRRIRWECTPKPEPSPEEIAKMETQLQAEKKERRRFEIPLREPTLSERQKSAAEAHEFCKKDRERLERVKRMHENHSMEEREREYERSMAILMEHLRRERLTPRELRCESAAPLSVNVRDFESAERYLASMSSRRTS
ncbi:hypothetical protein V5O48_009408 [Marasmius crinis-equi]|uniref:Uncharacterized protein n=1 Tax=Marasmius crinis-equi TaxID=585013 RepID=A0ABR3FB59_9AGAR